VVRQGGVRAPAIQRVFTKLDGVFHAARWRTMRWIELI
jgi:hypothetical protein